jgi:hypothetical protein
MGHAIYFARRAAWVAAVALCCAAAVSGCGVRFEVAQSPTPAPTPRPRVVRFADAVRQAAAPRIIFRDDKTADTLPFMAEDLNGAYLITGHTLSIHADYEGTWLNTQRGTGRVRLSLYSRHQENEAWALIGADSQDALVAYSQPGRSSGQLGVDFQPDGPGSITLRAEIEVSGRAADNLPVSASGATAFQVWVFTVPEAVATDPELIRPAFGALDPARLLLDWRGWGGGPCALASQDAIKAGERAILDGLESACAQAKAGRLAQATQDLVPLIDKGADDTLKAQILDQIGFLAAATGDLPTANQAFKAAAAHWLQVGAAAPFSSSDQNDAATRAVDTTTLPQLERLLEFSYQIDENPGRAIAESNYYFLAQDRYGLEDLMNNYFRERSLPQEAVIAAWIAKIDAAKGR